MVKSRVVWDEIHANCYNRSIDGVYKAKKQNPKGMLRALQKADASL